MGRDRWVKRGCRGELMGGGPFLMRRGLWGRDTNPNKAKEEKTELMEHKQRTLTLPERDLDRHRHEKQVNGL